jgi:hypothetical protein
MLLTLAQVRELILRKQQSEEGVATVWLTTAEMGFSLTEEPNEILCPKDVREGKGSDRYLAPAISQSAGQGCLAERISRPRISGGN